MSWELQRKGLDGVRIHCLGEYELPPKAHIPVAIETGGFGVVALSFRVFQLNQCNADETGSINVSTAG